METKKKPRQCDRFFPSQGPEDKQAPNDYFRFTRGIGQEGDVTIFSREFVVSQSQAKYKQETAYTNTCSSVPTLLYLRYPERDYLAYFWASSAKNEKGVAGYQVHVRAVTMLCSRDGFLRRTSKGDASQRLILR